MNKTRIEWCDDTWNPITGCFHECPYCYARKIAIRFSPPDPPSRKSPGMEGAVMYGSAAGFDTLIRLEKPYLQDGRVQPYPMGFLPTFHRYRLGEPAQKTRPRNIFVVSMGDLFGDWVPDDWIIEVFRACAAAPQHRYLFLTKNPARFQDSELRSRLKITDNMWFGFSAADQKTLNDITLGAQWLPQNLFISIEPILGAINLTNAQPTGSAAVWDFASGNRYWEMNGDRCGPHLRWAIVGAETGNRRGKVVPVRAWVDRITADCAAAGIPVFYKDNLRAYFPDLPASRFPWEKKEKSQ